MRKGHCQSDKHWNCLKGSIGETSERWGGVHNIYKQTLIYKYINFYDCVCELFFCDEEVVEVREGKGGRNMKNR